MGDHDGRHPPSQRRVREAVQVDQIGRERFLQLEQPGAGSAQIPIRAWHPFEREPAMDERETVNCRGREILFGRGRRPKHGEHHLDVAIW